MDYSEHNFQGFKVYRFGARFAASNSSRILFSHANGVAAGTYHRFLSAWSESCQIPIDSYDIRGMGQSQMAERSAYHARGVWEVLTHDLVRLASDLDLNHHRLILAGHSLGAWLSLLAGEKLNPYRVFLMDMPLLTLRYEVQWALACSLGLRNFHFLAKKARNRKVLFPADMPMAKLFQKNSFFKGWPDVMVDDYIRANFEEVAGALQLRHDPAWEAEIFEHMPASPWLRFLKLQKSYRHHLNVSMIAGSESDVCDAKAQGRFQWFFPASTWYLLPHAGHMFPFERTDSLLALLKTFHMQD